MAVALEELRGQDEPVFTGMAAFTAGSRALLDEALDLSLAARSTPLVTLCLAGYAQLAFADGNPDRAALLEGAAEGLRRRVGLPAWPHVRHLEADLVARARHRLGASRFDRAFSAGSGQSVRTTG